MTEMMTRIFNYALLVCVEVWVFIPVHAATQQRWTVEISGGGTYCIQTPLTIRQAGYDDIEMSAQYDTHSFTPPLYYALRFGAWHNKRAWELELVHLKLDLANTPDTVQRFEISHGYNLLTVNRAWMKSQYVFRVGAGIVLAHPENTIRSQQLDEHQGILQTGYVLTGPAAHIGLSRSFALTSNFSVGIEGKLSGAYARVPVADGHAAVPNLALHALIGVGYSF